MPLIDVPLLLAAFDTATLMWWMNVILKVGFGLGAVIFVHELGHFLVARACGVKCEKFMIGFDIGGYKISRRWGETEYGIGILPMGGYVKMLGQDDDPAHISEQLRKSQVTAGNPDAVEVNGPKGERYLVDRRSYLAKSVPQRMAIISAGVIMNVIFAVIFATVAYRMGVPYLPCIVSETAPGSPAWRAGIEPGDEIIQIGTTINPTFLQLRGGVTLGDLENGIPCVVRRAADGKEVDITLRPDQGRGLATIGIVSPRTLTLANESPAIPGLPAADAKLVDPTSGDKSVAAGFQGGDEIVRVNETPVSDYRGFAAEVARGASKPLLVTVKRSHKQAKAATVSGDEAPRQAQELTYEVPTHPMRRFGLVMKMGPITAVQNGSAAAEAGLKAGDTIVAVDGQSLESASSETDWDAATLPEKMRQKAEAGATVKLTILRGLATDDSADASGGDTRERLDIDVTPRVATTYHTEIAPRVPVGVPALGIAYRIENQVVGVVAESVAARAKFEPGDKIISAKLLLPTNGKKKSPKPMKFKIGPNEPNMAFVLDQSQLAPAGTSVEFELEHGKEERTATVTPEIVDGLFVTERGFNLMPIERIRQASTIGEAFRYGAEETRESLGMVFRFLQKIGRQVPVTAIGGPLTIAGAAAQQASVGMSTFLIFLTMLSANLAVLNFLPIPLLDGGHMVFLAYEGIRGRPASEKFVVAMHTIGFVFIVGLMLFAMALDVNLIPRNL